MSQLVAVYQLATNLSIFWHYTSILWSGSVFFFLIQIQRFIHYLHDAANLTYNYNWYVKYKDFSERKFDVRCVKIRHSQNSFLILTRRYLMCLYRFRCIIGIRLITVNAKRNKKFHFKKWSQIDFDAEKNCYKLIHGKAGGAVVSAHLLGSEIGRANLAAKIVTVKL